MFIINMLKKLFKALRSDSSPNQLAFGFALGMILGLTPFWNIHNLVLIFIIAIVKVNISSVVFGFAIFRMLSPLFDGLFHNFGQNLLQMNSLQGLWQLLYSNTFFVLVKFNNTLVLGSLVISLILFIPVYFGFPIFAKFYKNTLHAKIEKLKITNMLKGSKIFKLINTGYQLKK